MYKVTPEELKVLVAELYERIRIEGHRYVYGIPRGGSQVALALYDYSKMQGHKLDILNEIYFKNINEVAIIDDLVDSGRTLQPYIDMGYRTYVLYTKKKHSVGCGYSAASIIEPGVWIQFPWETSTSEENLVTRMLEYIGEDPSREGLRETPKRVLKAWEHWFSGYKKNPADIMKVFHDDTSQEMVMLKDIQMYSTCEHHLAPFIGKAHIAYVPNGKILGASKLARLLDIYARRLQIQERIAQQVVDALEEHLQPLGAACYIEAQHLCISSRGVEKQGSTFVTSALSGCFQTNPAARAELFAMIK